MAARFRGSWQLQKKNIRSVIIVLYYHLWFIFYHTNAKTCRGHTIIKQSFQNVYLISRVWCSRWKPSFPYILLWIVCLNYIYLEWTTCTLSNCQESSLHNFPFSTSHPWRVLHFYSFCWPFLCLAFINLIRIM